MAPSSSLNASHLRMSLLIGPLPPLSRFHTFACFSWLPLSLRKILGVALAPLRRHRKMLAPSSFLYLQSRELKDSRGRDSETFGRPLCPQHLMMEEITQEVISQVVQRSWQIIFFSYKSIIYSSIFPYFPTSFSSSPSFSSLCGYLEMLH